MGGMNAVAIAPDDEICQANEALPSGRMPASTGATAGAADPQAGLDALAGIASAIASTTALTEESFLQAGSVLEQAIGILGRMVATSEALAAELDSADVRTATSDLGEAASGVAALADAEKSHHTTLCGMDAMIHAVTDRTERLDNTIRALYMLSVSAKIEAARLGDIGGEFADFSTELERAVKLARETLGEFGAEMASVRGHVENARNEEARFSMLHEAAIRSVPGQIRASLGALAARGRDASSVAATIAARTQAIGLQVAASVAALQIGDRTRQRAEHAEEAITLALSLAAAATAGPEASAGSLTPPGREAVVAVCCELEAAQLDDAAGELDREVETILDSLQALMREAHDIARIGRNLYGSERGHTFLHDLQESIAAAHICVDGFSSARRAIGNVVEAVTNSTAQLAGQIGIMQTLETDIRLLALNAALNCARIGTDGRALTVIAQELGACASETTAQTGVITTELEKMLSFSEMLAAPGLAQDGLEATDAGERMTRSVGRLATSGERVSDALGALQKDCDDVAQLLGNAASRMAGQRQFGKVLRQSADDLAAIAGEMGGDAEDAAEHCGGMLMQVAARYTIEQERKVHDRVAARLGLPGISTAAAQAMPAAADVSIDDMLF